MAFVIGEGGPKDRNAIQLATRAGTWIKNERRLERAPEALAAAIAMCAPFGGTLRSITGTYNCVGMVFASRRTWVQPDELAPIFGDDGYREIADSEAMEGDIVLYRDGSGDPCHVGVVFQRTTDVSSATTELIVLSKWGANGEYLHGRNQLPVLLLGKSSVVMSESRRRF